jgi:hypothetical protein
MLPYDLNRGLTTALGVGIAGFLVWVATQVGQQTTPRFWGAMAIVAAAGLVAAASQLLGGWTKWGAPRVSIGVLLVGFLPVLVCVGWVLLATQPGSGWHEQRLVDWSHSLGIFGVVRELGLYHGVLAFAFGLTLGFCFDTAGLRSAATTTETRRIEPVPARAADEPATAERDEVDGVPVGLRRVPARMD